MNDKNYLAMAVATAKKKKVGAYYSAGVRFTDLDDVHSGRYPRELRYGNPRAINAGRAIYPVR